MSETDSERPTETPDLGHSFSRLPEMAAPPRSLKPIDRTYPHPADLVTVGDIIHVVCPETDALPQNDPMTGRPKIYSQRELAQFHPRFSRGDHFAAIVVAVYPGESPSETTVNAQAFPNFSTLGFYLALPYDESGDPGERGSWHWREGRPIG